MFRKIITNLPFQPATLGQLSLYIRCIHKEEFLRLIGLILVVCILATQVFTILFSSSASLTTNPSDIIYGANNREEIIQAYIDNRDKFGHTDIKQIFNYYGIGDTQISSAKPTTIQVNDNSDYIVASRNSNNFADNFINIPAANNNGVFEFPLNYWHNGKYGANYPTLTGMSSFGFRFWILLNGSGNIVYEKGAKKPSLEIVEQLKSNPSPNQNDIAAYSLLFRNSGTANSLDTTISSRLPAELEYQSYESSVDLTLVQSGQLLTWKLDNSGGILAPSTRWSKIEIKAKVKSAAPIYKQACNTNAIYSSNGPIVTSDNTESNTCITPSKLTCPGTGAVITDDNVNKCAVVCPDGSTSSYDKSCLVPQLTCQSLAQIAAPSWDTRKYITNLLAQKGANVQKITYYVNDKKISTVALEANAKTNEFTYTYPAAGKYKITAELTGDDNSVQQSQNCTLDETISYPNKLNPHISTDLKVTNITQKINDANGSMARAGDQLKYTITVINNGSAAANDFALSGEYAEDISDILEYANLTDQQDAKFNQKTGVLTWPAQDIKPSNIIEKSFTVTIKNPLPSTPISKSNPLSFNFELNNKYGRNTTIYLHKPLAKKIEQATNIIPQSSKPATLLSSMVLVLIVSYFYFRSRLLKKESTIIHQEYSSGGM